MYDRRLNYLRELVKMGADIEILSSYLAAIKGPTFLHAVPVKALDLRSGAALVLAALSAEGETQIDNIEIIERGYENIEEKLKNIGAEIKRLEE
jgi:UDP-N-acetylglucosamine 1-carboxyvinyltransferase